MTRKERLTSILQNKPTDRPAVCFYEVGGFDIDPNNPDPYNVYNDPSWLPLLQLAEEKTDLIRMVPPDTKWVNPELRNEFYTHETWENENSRFTKTTININGRQLTQQTRRDKDTDTIWELEHFLKGDDDLTAYLALPDELFEMSATAETAKIKEEKLGEKGIVMIDIANPICYAAGLFSMEDYTITAFSNPSMFHALLEKMAKPIYKMVKDICEEFPNHLWRIYGPEYASEPYLPPALFDEYVVKYDKPICDMIRNAGGYPRIHSHGRLKNILPSILKMNPAGLDPIEPPPQGDVELIDVRREYGKDLVLFGNIELSWLELLPEKEFEEKVRHALDSGTCGEGRGFVLMPTAAPYGRHLSAKTLRNYESMVRLVDSL